jgi:hypothetical protein
MRFGGALILFARGKASFHSVLIVKHLFSCKVCLLEFFNGEIQNLQVVLCLGIVELVCVAKVLTMWHIITNYENRQLAYEVSKRLKLVSTFLHSFPINSFQQTVII